MRIGIISDTHDCLPMIAKAVRLLRDEKVEHVLHAGDFIAPFSVKALADLSVPITAVYGNNDGEKAGLKAAFEGLGELHEGTRLIELGGRRILMGHEPPKVRRRGAEVAADVWVYGHTHEAEVTRQDDILLINPGEACGYLTGRAMLALLDTDTLQTQLLEL